jgi:hypothetical protein
MACLSLFYMPFLLQCAGHVYSTKVNELNQLAAYYIQQLKARATRRKNGVKTDEEPPITLAK